MLPSRRVRRYRCRVLILIRLLHNPFLQWALLLSVLLAVGLGVPVPGPSWVPWATGTIAALGSGFLLGSLREKLTRSYLEEHPLTAEEQREANARAAARINRR